jgi:uncharacterized membrane protein YsdA (DUF1294 family)
MQPQTREILLTALVCGAIGALCIAGYLIHKTTMLDGLWKVAALVVYGDAS